MTRRPHRLVAHNWGTTTLGDCVDAFSSLLRPGRLVDGPDIAAYERHFAQRVGANHGVSFASGRVALYAILRSLGIGAGHEVLLQVPTHIVVANAVRYTGATVRYVDCRLDDYNMDLELAETLVGPTTRALLLQHTFGIPADLDAARALCDRHGLVLIEDCVHALGASYRGRPVGSHGQVAFFSTEETKTISSTMGGMAVTDDRDLADELRSHQEGAGVPERSLVARYLVKQIMYHLFTHPAIHRFTQPVYLWLRERPAMHLAPGATSEVEKTGERPDNYVVRYSNAQARIALRQLARLDENLQHRQRIAAAWAEGLGERFTLPVPVAGAEPAFVRYPIRVADRPEAMRSAAPHVVLGQWFNQVLEEAKSDEDGSYVSGTCPRAEQAGRELVNLPTHPRTSPRDVEAILGVFATIRAAGETPD